jgi:outer membrane protein, heavy metal efflux system
MSTALGRALRGLATGLLLACGAAGAQTLTPPPLGPLTLPPVGPTRDVIAALPQVLAARAGVAVAQARSERLQAGTYEWAFKAGAQQRRDSTGAQYAESDFAIERSIRWGNKSDADKALGAAGVLAGELSYADVWHESVRGLLQSWYDWQRARSAQRVHDAQLTLAQQQLDVVARRVKAGEAPRMDLLMTQAERDRVQASLAQAQGRAQVQMQELQKRFPGLVLTAEPPAIAGVPLSLMSTESATSWVARIVDDNHEVELAQAEARMARLQSERAQLDSRPDPLLGVRTANERGGQENIVGVYVTIPLTGAYRAAEQRATLALAEAAEQRLNLTRQKVEAMAQRVVLQAEQHQAAWQRLQAVQVAMDEVAQLAIKAYGLGELTLTEALQARRAALEAALAADAARWDALESVARVLVDAHQLWAADEHTAH